MVGIDLEAAHVELILLLAGKDGETVCVLDGAVSLLRPDALDVGILGATHGIVLHFPLAEALAVLLRHHQLRFGKVGLHHLRVVRVVLRDGVARLRCHLQRVFHLLSYVCQVNLRQRNELDVGILRYLDTLHDVLQRRQQCRELTRLRVGLYVDVLCVAVFAGPCAAVDGGGVALEGAHVGAGLVVVVVEETALVVQLQRNLGFADEVLRLAEAHGQGVVPRGAIHATHEVHQRRVGKIVGHGSVEVVQFVACGEATSCHHRVSIHFGRHIVLADGHRHRVVAVGIGLHRLAVLRLQLTVHIHEGTLYGDVRAGIAHVALHREARHILEVGSMYECITAHVEQLLDGVELMYAIERNDGVGGASTSEGYSLDDVVAFIIGLCL